jgi:hypothetical protein
LADRATLLERLAMTDVIDAVRKWVRDHIEQDFQAAAAQS